MPRTVTVRRRSLRSVTFAFVLTASAVLAHVFAGGMLPRPTVVAGCAGALLVVGWALSGRDRAVGTVAGAALAGQLALHATFSLTMRGGMAMSSVLCGHQTQATSGVATMHVRSPGMSATSHQMLLMTFAHLLGGLVVLLGCRSVEAVAAAISGALSAVLLHARPALAAPAVRVRRPCGSAFRVRISPVFVGSPRRGPPVSVRS